MKTFLRCLNDYRDLWRIWVPLSVLTVASVPVVLGMPLVYKQIVDDAVLPKRFDLLAPVAAKYAGLWLFTAASQVVRRLLSTYVNERASLGLRKQLLAHSEELSLAFSQREHSGRTTALFHNDVPNLAGLFSNTLITWISSVTLLIAGVGLMFQLSWQLAVGAGIAPLLVAGMATVATRPLRPLARQAQDKAAELTEYFQENLAGLREIVAFGREQAEARRLAKTLTELLGLRMRVAFIDSTIQAGENVFSLVVNLVLLAYGGYLVIDGQTTLGTLFAMQTLFGMILQPAGQFFGMISTLQRALASADRIHAFLDERPRVEDRPNAHAPDCVLGEIRFERVTFGYDPERTVLQDVSFRARPGEMIALVGPSGAGKSTVMSLIARFYDPLNGTIRLDGVDLREIRLSGLRAHLGMVFQDTFLFAASIRDNLAFGQQSATDEDIIAAARAANAWEFIERLPAGLDTFVGERGVRLSEGQKQRLAIARALLRDPRVLILDEPTSALDARSEHLLQTALNNLVAGRTTFVVAHRLATIRRADRILVMERGRIVEQGTHTSLLEHGGLYASLFRLQFAQDGEPLPNLSAGGVDLERCCRRVSSTCEPGARAKICADRGAAQR